MPVSAAKDPRQALGRNPDRLTLEERTALAGKMIALEVYSPDTFPSAASKPSAIRSMPASACCKSAVSTRAASSFPRSGRPTEGEKACIGGVRRG